MRYLIKVSSYSGSNGFPYVRLYGTGNFSISGYAYDKEKSYASYVGKHNSYKTLTGATKALEKMQKMVSTFKDWNVKCELVEINC